MTIRKKFILFIGTSVFFILCAVLVLGYFSFFLPRLKTIGLTQTQIAQQLSYTFELIVNEDLKNLPAFFNLHKYQNKIQLLNNSRYHSMTPEAFSLFMKEMDKGWASSGPGTESYRNYLDVEICRDLERLQKEHVLIGEVLLTDDRGGLVASNGKTTDYYQADEEWWQKAYAEGRGAIYVGEVEYDASSGVYGIPLAFPVKNNGSKTAGVCKVIISMGPFFQILENFESQGRGHVTLLDHHFRILFHSGVEPLSRSVPEFSGLFQRKKNTSIGQIPSLHGRKDFIYAFADVNPLISGDPLHWHILICQNKERVLQPLFLFLFRFSLVAFMLLAGLLFLGFMFARAFVKPLEKLSKATEHVALGNLEHELDIRTGDEIETLAESFNKMTEALRRTNAQRESAETDLKKALAAKNEFMATVSHEFKTPLTAIREGVQLVVDGSLGSLNEDQKDCLGVVKGNIERLVRLIGDILDLQRLESGKISFHFKMEDFHEAVREASQTMAFAAHKKDLEILLNLDKNAAPVFMDRDKIVQVLGNLLHNAVKFTEKGRIIVTTDFQKDRVLVSVHDSGIGIKPQDIPKLFQRFSQIAREGYTKTGGTGLGLVISQEIIRRHKGTIWIDSEEKKGTKVFFTLPVSASKISYVKKNTDC